MKLNIDSLTNKERESVDFDFCENRGEKRVQEAVYLGA